MHSNSLSCGILLFNTAGELLLGHAAGSARWDIPKGVAETDELPIAAAVREAAEETGLRLPPNGLLEVGRFSYLRGKDLALFAAVVDGLDASMCVCTSYFRDARGRQRPELDAFAWVPWDEVPGRCGRSLAAVLATIQPHTLIARCLPITANFSLAR